MAGSTPGEPELRVDEGQLANGHHYGLRMSGYRVHAVTPRGCASAEALVAEVGGAHGGRAPVNMEEPGNQRN